MAQKRNRGIATVTCGIFLYDIRQKKILACHATNAPWHTWSIPKGIKELNEDSFTCACRELKEETGIDMNKLSVMENYELEPIHYEKQNKVLESFLVVTDTSLNEHLYSCSTFIKEGLPEVNGWKWISIEHMSKYLHETQWHHIDKIKSIISGKVSFNAIE
ncbi:MAG TPA: NUDIX hydrolase [Flavobacteriales bacterium]|nr:NUDIX hydrolase [Flavobacteriales bacterium]